MTRDSLGTLTGDVNHERESQQHWSPVSEDYASVEVLLGYLGQGWVLDDLVVTETIGGESGLW